VDPSLIRPQVVVNLHERVESLLPTETWYTRVSRDIKGFFGFHSPIAGVPVTPPNDNGGS
jgi:hypothetical protein